MYLSYGLAVILAFIGVKLILHALHENNVPFINEGQPVNVVEVSTGLSLAVIIGVLVVTVIASLTSPKGRAQNLVSAARRHATEYLMCRPTPRYARTVPEAASRGGPHAPAPGKYRARIREEEKLMELLKEGPRRARGPCGEPTHAPSAWRAGRVRTDRGSAGSMGGLEQQAPTSTSLRRQATDRIRGGLYEWGELPSLVLDERNWALLRW